jgi:hypothetical protein
MSEIAHEIKVHVINTQEPGPCHCSLPISSFHQIPTEKYREIQIKLQKYLTTEIPRYVEEVLGCPNLGKKVSPILSVKLTVDEECSTFQRSFNTYSRFSEKVFRSKCSLVEHILEEGAVKFSGCDLPRKIKIVEVEIVCETNKKRNTYYYPEEDEKKILKGIMDDLNMLF